MLPGSYDYIEKLTKRGYKRLQWWKDSLKCIHDVKFVNCLAINVWSMQSTV